MTNRESAPLFTSVPLEDPHALGYFNLQILQKKCNLVIEYTPTWSDRITGMIKGCPEEIQKVFRDLENNAPVGVRDLIGSIKFVRSKIFQEKQRVVEQRERHGAADRLEPKPRR